MKIFVLGGDGFCGWATALHLSKHNHTVTIIDNLSRREIDLKNNMQSVTPIADTTQRINKWYELTSKVIKTCFIDIANNYNELLQLICHEEPEVIIHFAEQRSAPYSMKDPYCKNYTVSNNVNGTTNLLTAIAESKLDIHLIHLGTMGVYGYGALPDTIIPEGYVTVDMHTSNGKKSLEILHPAYPGSIYHTTKCLDALLFQFYNKNDNIRITDLHQGIVWGYETEETKLHPDLINRLDVDQYYGTVLNRFILEAVCDHPLTVYGSGGQTRAFIHIQDTVKCIRLAAESCPGKQRVRIFNQMAETQSVKYLAECIKEWFGAKVKNIENPRKELDENELDVKNDGLKNLGWEPILICKEELQKIYNGIIKYKNRINIETINPTHKW